MARTAQPERPHVLVLGAGLAGLRAAWAAARADPGLRVSIACPRKGPSGSSFANRNDALGLQCPGEGEARAFETEALALAPPGEARPELVRALAEDAPRVLEELLALGLAFRRDPEGRPRRFAGCFSQTPRALVFDGLASAHAAFAARALDLGVRTLPGVEALALARDASGRACGAWLAPLRGGAPFLLRADAVVAALGGPAPLFARRICGPGGRGLSLGFLLEAGAVLVNARFLQCFWGRAEDGGFVNPGGLPWERLAPELAHLAQARRSHCPVAYALPDTELDRWLLARRGPDGVLRLPELPPLALFAHAGNGGARIDPQGRTAAPGLLACGECAGGMHGAQRLGGGMVLAALCFGRRAGEAAARLAGQAPAGIMASPPPQGLELPARPAFVRRLRHGMDRHGLPFAQDGPKRSGFAAWLRTCAAGAPALRERLLARSALCLLEG